MTEQLRTNFKDDILAESMEGKRRYQMLQNEDGTVSFVDVTEYEQVGSDFGQAELNATNQAIIELQNEQVETVDPMTATEEGLAADAKLTGDAIRDLSANLSEFDLTVQQVVDKLNNYNPAVYLSGTVTFAGMGPGVSKSQVVNFSKAFNSVPKVIVSTNGGAGTAKASGITQTGFIFTASRPDEGFGQATWTGTWNASAPGFQ